MKYYHLIYNSSERSIKGAPGFGIRAYSEDLPKEVLNAIEKDRELFAFEYKGTNLTTNIVHTNPESIKGIIPTWIYAVIPIGEGKKVYVLGRKIAVGFDYSFYKTGQPTRLGNYVGDYYITLDSPSSDFWNLMYTRDDGVQFIPASPVPTQDNDDMRSISLGEPKLLSPMENIVAAAPKAKGVHAFALEIIFGILESRKLQKPLLVKMASKETAEVMADVFRILPSDVATECPFITNYNQTGRRQGYNIFVINEEYQAQVMAEQWMVVDLINGKTVNSKERDIFLPIVQNYTDRGVWNYVRNTMMWILSDSYANIGNSDPNLNSLVLCYLNKDEFDFENLSQNKELINALAPILEKDEEKRDYLFDYLWFNIRNITKPEQIKQMSQELSALKPLGTDAIANEWKPDATKIVFKSSDAFLTLYNSVRGDLNSVANVIDYSECVNHKNFLSSFARHPDVWRTLRPLFIPNAASNFESFVMLTIKEGFDYDNTEKAVDEVNPNKTQFVDSLIAIYEKTESKETLEVSEIHKKAIEFIASTIKSIDYYPFIENLPNRYSNNICQQLYLWDIQQNIARKLTAVTIDDCTETLNSLATVFRNVSSLKEEVQKLSTPIGPNINKLIGIVSCLHSAYNAIITKDSSLCVDKTIIQEIEKLVKIFGISVELIQKHAGSHPLAKTLNSVLETYSILKNDISNFSEAQVRKAIEIKRPLYVRATLPYVLKKKLNPSTAYFVATEYVKCGAIYSDDLLREVQKPEYKQNRNAIWATVLHNLGHRPEYLVQKIAGLYEEPDEKGKYSKTATDRALDFMEHNLPEEYEAWNKKNNSPMNKFFRAIRCLFKKSSPTESKNEAKKDKSKRLK